MSPDISATYFAVCQRTFCIFFCSGWKRADKNDDVVAPVSDKADEQMRYEWAHYDNTYRCRIRGYCGNV